MTDAEKQKIVDVFEVYNCQTEYTEDEVALRDYYGANREGARSLAAFYAGYLARETAGNTDKATVCDLQKQIEDCALASVRAEKVQRRLYDKQQELRKQLRSVEIDLAETDALYTRLEQKGLELVARQRKCQKGEQS
jgi:hypothetical protein